MTAGAGAPLSMAAFIFSQIASRRAYQSILGFEEPFGRPPLLRISSVRLGSAIGVCSICSSISFIVPPGFPFPLLQPHGWRRLRPVQKAEKFHTVTQQKTDYGVHQSTDMLSKTLQDLKHMPDISVPFVTLLPLCVFHRSGTTSCTRAACPLSVVFQV